MQLRDMNVVAIAPERAVMNLPFAGRLQHYLNNWECITQDSWVLDAVKGLWIDFRQQPWQITQPAELVFSKE